MAARSPSVARSVETFHQFRNFNDDFESRNKEKLYGRADTVTNLSCRAHLTNGRRVYKFKYDARYEYEFYLLYIFTIYSLRFDASIK